MRRKSSFLRQSILYLFVFISCRENKNEYNCKFGESFGILGYSIERTISHIDTNKADSNEAKFLIYTLKTIDTISNYLVKNAGGMREIDGRKVICNNEILRNYDLIFVMSKVKKVQSKIKFVDMKCNYVRRISQYFILSKGINKAEFDSVYIYSSQKIPLALDFLSFGNDLCFQYLLPNPPNEKYNEDSSKK